MGFLVPLFHALLIYQSVNSAISPERLDYAIDEESPVNTTIGFIISDSPLISANKQSKELYCHEFHSEWTELFQIDRATSRIFTTSRIDREQLCTSPSAVSTDHCQLEFIAVCKCPSRCEEIWITVAIEIRDIDDHLPTFPNDNVTTHRIMFKEDVPVGFRYVLPSARDLDSGLNAVIKYTLKYDGEDNPFSLIVPDSDEHVYLTVVHKLDREKVDNYSLKLMACGPTGVEQHCATKSLLVILLDVNDNPPRLISPKNDPMKFTLSEASAVGTELLQIIATDADAGESGVLDYKLIKCILNETQRATLKDSGSQNGQLCPVSVEPRTGLVRLIAPLSASMTNSFNTVIRISDHGIPVQYIDVELQIFIEDTNDHAPLIQFKQIGCDRGKINLTDQYNLTVRSNVENGTHLSLIFVSDMDLGRNGVVECFSKRTDTIDRTYHLDFKLTDGGIISGRQVYMLEVIRPFLGRFNRPTMDKVSFETLGPAKLLVVCQDHGEPHALTSSIELSIFLTEQDDRDLCFEQDVYKFVLEETVQPIKFIHKPQLQELLDDVRFTLVSTNDSEEEACSQIMVDRLTGHLSAPNGLDREQCPLVTCSLIASDLRSNRNATTKIELVLQDINDNVPTLIPTILINGFTLIEWDSYEVGFRQSPIIVGNLSSLDPDVKENGTVRYKLGGISARSVQPTSESRFLPIPQFKIDPTSGQISLAVEEHKLIDREQVSAYELQLILEDTGSIVKQTSVQFFKIHIIDVNDNIPEWTPSLIFHKPGSNLNELIDPIQLNVTWSADKKNSHVFRTKLSALDRDQGENAFISFRLLEWNELPSLITYGKFPVPVDAFEFHEDGLINLFSHKLATDRSYVLGVTARDHGITRRLQCSGYFYIDPSSFRLVPPTVSLHHQSHKSTSLTSSNKYIDFMTFLILSFCLLLFILLAASVLTFVFYKRRSNASKTPSSLYPHLSQTNVDCPDSSSILLDKNDYPTGTLSSTPMYLTNFPVDHTTPQIPSHQFHQFENTVPNHFETEDSFLKANGYPTYSSHLSNPPYVTNSPQVLPNGIYIPRSEFYTYGEQIM